MIGNLFAASLGVALVAIVIYSMFDWAAEETAARLWESVARTTWAPPWYVQRHRRRLARRVRS